MTRNRWRRVGVGLLGAYAASMTLYASQWAAEAWVYRRFYESVVKGGGYQPPPGPPLLTIARDYGWPRTGLETLSLAVADFRGPILVPAVVGFFLLGLGAGLIRLPSYMNPKKED